MHINGNGDDNIMSKYPLSCMKQMSFRKSSFSEPLIINRPVLLSVIPECKRLKVLQNMVSKPKLSTSPSAQPERLVYKWMM